MTVLAPTPTAVHTVLRLRSQVAESAIAEALAGKIPGDADYDVLLTGPARIVKPDGQPLCIYLPGAMREFTQDPEVYGIFHGLRSQMTDNRGKASGTRKLLSTNGTRYRTMPVPSAMIGAADSQGTTKYCRLTAWTGQHMPEWERLQGFFQGVAWHMAQHVPDRYAAQLGHAEQTDPAWVIPGTPFTTVTVNNTYPTGVHTDRGDLDEGFSSIAVFRRGEYAGGRLLFPGYRVAADLHDGDLILMDAHEWHGNTPIVCACGERPLGPCRTCSAERISVVSYFRTRMTRCGTADEELHAAQVFRERKLHQ